MPDCVAAEDQRVTRRITYRAVEIAHDLSVRFCLIVKMPVGIGDLGSHGETPAPKEIVGREVVLQQFVTPSRHGGGVAPNLCRDFRHCRIQTVSSVAGVLSGRIGMSQAPVRRYLFLCE